MDFLASGVKAGIYGLMIFSVLAAIASVTLRNLFRSAVALSFVLIGVAGIYLALRAEFLAMVQILVYVGAVMTLVIFAVMLTARLSDKRLRARNGLSLPALGSVLLFTGLLGQVIESTPWPLREGAAEPLPLARMGEVLMTRFVFPFEVIGIVLFAVLIGAIVIARRDREAS